jgi:DNA repair exonuclease SbcCD ATPase subunit
MIEHIPLALSSLKAAKDIITTIKDVRDFDKIATATAELKERLIEAIDNILASKEQLLAFHERISDLEKENNHLKDWSIEKSQYEPKQVVSGVFVEIIKNYKGSFEQAYKLCDNCFNKTIFSPLQQSKKPNSIRILTCPNGCPPIEFHRYLENPEKSDE